MVNSSHRKICAPRSCLAFKFFEYHDVSLAIVDNCLRWRTNVQSACPQSTHPILGDELRALRRLQREQDKSPFVFTSERGTPFTTAGFARMVERAGVEAGLGFKAHPHMLRHACGYAFPNRGHDTRALQASRAQKHPAYGTLHRTIAVTVQGFLADLTGAASLFALAPPQTVITITTTL
jgi:Phage integrase family